MRDTFLSRVSENRVRDGIEFGVIAGAATAGALMGFGHARGATLQPLITGGALVLHFVSMIIWGLLLAYIAAPLSGVARAIAPVSVGVLAYLVDRFIAPNGLRPGFEQLLSSGETTFIYVVLAAALAAGLWASSHRVPHH
jgi:hypothetical protein